ncbi:MAG: DUF3786 domain-containing protein, partial [Anaerolineae bacterium]|nr:DUF3786 domain-containing protein [Anaerolineae bacterium]
MMVASSGVTHIWDRLVEINPTRVCRRSQAVYDAMSAVYVLKSFGCELAVSLHNRSVYFSPSKLGKELKEKIGNDLSLSSLYYLTSARDMPVSQRLVGPSSLPGGQIFVKGSHVLPLDEVACRYDANPADFIKKGEEFGGHCLEYTDASLRIYPFPRIPVVIILRRGDDEFQARVDILLDDSCTLHL